MVRIRTNDQLNEDSQNKFIQALNGIAEKYIGKGRTKKPIELYKKIENRNAGKVTHAQKKWQILLR